MLIAGVLLGVVLILALLLLKNRRAYEEELEKATALLEGVIQGGFPIEELTYSEGQEAKLVFKAMRVAEINRTYAERADAEEKKMQELIADISHQMRTPLSSILMYTELMADEHLPQKEQDEFLNRLTGSAEKLSWLISEFITISRFEAKSIQLQPERGLLNETVYQAIEMNKEHGERKNIHVQFDPQIDIELSHDIRWTREAISNVLDNAVKYAFEGSKVTIEIEKLVYYTRVRIVNSGETLSSTEQLQAFQKYYRGANAQAKDGAGIGLYLVKMILEEQGGYGILESRNNQTAVSLFLLN